MCLLQKQESVEIEGRYYKNSITSANNLYFYSLDEDTEEFTSEYMLLMETIIDIKLIDSNTYAIINERVPSITIRILNNE